VELADYLRALRKSWPHVLAVAVLAVVLAIVVTARSTRIYTSSVTLFVSTAGSAESVSALYDGGLAAQQRVRSYADLVASDRVAAEVIDRLHLPDAPGELAGRISGHAVSNTVLLRVSVRDRDPVAAQRIANEVGTVFTTEIARVEAPTSLVTAAAGGLPGGPALAPASPVRVSVWEAAKRPGHAISPKAGQNIALGLLAGLALGICLAVVRFRLDTSVKRAGDVAAAADLPTIGAIAYDRATRGQSLTVVDRPRLPRAEAFRQLRTNLQFVAVDTRPQLITITSCRPNDGKTTTALNLAAVLAQSGSRVLAVEADLRRPSFGSYLGIEAAAGLTSVLAGQARPREVMQPIAKGQVLAIASGRVPPNPSELLGSRAMADLLTELRGEFDHVIIDAPPILAVTDAAVLSTLTDGTILIARAGRTRRADLAQARTLLRNVDASILGVVLNMVPTKGPDAYAYAGGYAPRGGQHLARPARIRPGRRWRVGLAGLEPALPGAGGETAPDLVDEPDEGRRATHADLDPIGLATAGPRPVATSPVATSPVATGPVATGPVATSPVAAIPAAAGSAAARPAVPSLMGPSPLGPGPLGPTPLGPTPLGPGAANGAGGPHWNGRGGAWTSEGGLLRPSTGPAAPGGGAEL